MVETHQPSNIVFSINTASGKKTTNLNGSQAVDFQFEISEPIISHQEIIRTNSYLKIKDRLSEIETLELRLNFVKILEPIYQNNLLLIDSLLPEILAYSILYFFEGKAESLKDMAEVLRKINPLKFDSKRDCNFYAYKLTRLLSEISLGMEPNSVWKSQYNTMGGSLFVEGHEKIVLTNVCDKTDFEDYLFQNSRFEMPSNSTNEFGAIYTKNGKQFINLRLQIRFV